MAEAERMAQQIADLAAYAPRHTAVEVAAELDRLHPSAQLSSRIAEQHESASSGRMRLRIAALEAQQVDDVHGARDTETREQLERLLQVYRESHPRAKG